MLRGNPESGPFTTNPHADTLDEIANVQYTMNTTDWDVLFDSERFQEIDDEGNIIPNCDSIEYDPEMENPLHDAYVSQSEGTLMDEVIRTFSSPRFAIQESPFADPSSSNISRPSSSVKWPTRSNRPGLPLLGLATLSRTLTTHLLSTPTYPHPDRHVHPHPHPHPSPHPNETLYRYQKLFIQALSQAASAKARHPRKPKENVVGQGNGISGKRRSAKPGGPRSNRVKGSRKSVPMSAAVKTRLQMDVDEYRKECHSVYSRRVFGQGLSSGTGAGAGSGQGIGMTGAKWDEEMEDSGDSAPSMIDDEDTGFGMQVEALSDRFSGAFISN